MERGGLGRAKEIRIKVFGGDTIGQIERRVEEWCSENPEAVVLDIKFAYSLSHRVMIIYRQEAGTAPAY